jgi:hypothetical protein
MVARYILLFLCAVAAVFGPSGDTAAQRLAEPSGRVILEVSGKVSSTNAPGRARFDLKALEALGITKLTTSTPWTEGKKVFEGIRVSDLLKAVGADGTTITPVALNDYKLDIPREDFDKYPVILAYRMDGEELRVRDKGPLWIVYPRDDFPELDNRLIRSRWVWQVKELMVR